MADAIVLFAPACFAPNMAPGGIHWQDRPVATGLSVVLQTYEAPFFTITIVGALYPFFLAVQVWVLE